MTVPLYRMFKDVPFAQKMTLTGSSLYSRVRFQDVKVSTSSLVQTVTRFAPDLTVKNLYSRIKRVRLKKVESLNKFSGKTFIVRIDSDVDVVDGKIVDDYRLETCLPTLEFILASKTKREFTLLESYLNRGEQSSNIDSLKQDSLSLKKEKLIKKGGGKIILVGHRGRPKGKDESLSLLPVAQWFAKEFGGKVEEIKVGEFAGWRINEDISLLENIRFYPGEEENNPEFARDLAVLGEVFVNEAFATSHRVHASTVGITQFLPSYAGLRFVLEVATLSKVMKNPKHPLVVVIGGQKIETKLPLVEKMLRFAEYILVGGKIADETKTLLEVSHKRIEGVKAVLLLAETIDSVDITDKSVENFNQIIRWAKTIVWNGTMGKVDEASHQETTKKLAEGIIESGAYSVVGGGDTVGFLDKNDIKGFSFVSVGGGAMLCFLAGETLPALKALEE